MYLCACILGALALSIYTSRHIASSKIFDMHNSSTLQHNISSITKWYYFMQAIANGSSKILLLQVSCLFASTSLPLFLLAYYHFCCRLKFGFIVASYGEIQGI